MSALDDLRQYHAELLKEARVANTRAEIVGRYLEELDNPPAAHVPTEIRYDHSQLDEPPRAILPEKEEPPKCNCGLKAEFKKSAPQNPKQWAAWFCARPKNDPKNCGFRKWVD